MSVTAQSAAIGLAALCIQVGTVLAAPMGSIQPAQTNQFGLPPASDVKTYEFSLQGDQKWLPLENEVGCGILCLLTKLQDYPGGDVPPFYYHIRLVLTGGEKITLGFCVGEDCVWVGDRLFVISEKSISKLKALTAPLLKHKTAEPGH